MSLVFIQGGGDEPENLIYGIRGGTDYSSAYGCLHVCDELLRKAGVDQLDLESGQSSRASEQFPYMVQKPVSDEPRIFRRKHYVEKHLFEAERNYPEHESDGDSLQ